MARHDGYSNHGDDKPLVLKRSDYEDSEDVLPLSSIISRNSRLDTPNKIIKDDESDDEAPISSRFKKKHGNGNTDEKKKPLVNNKLQNGSKVSSGKKRPLEKDSCADQSSMKKPKLSIEKQGDKRKAKQVSIKEDETDDDDEVPIAKRIKQCCISSATKPKGKRFVSPRSKKVTKSFLPCGDGKKKWTTLVHNGVTFPPPYKPHGTKMLHKGKPVNLSPEQEEVATMFAVMKETVYYHKPQFRENFWNDWRKLLGKNHVIQKLDDCDFTPIHQWHLEDKKSRKKKLQDPEDEKYMWAVVDGVKEKVGNYKVEPPGLFRGRGEHPKMGKLKRRIYPSDITLNIGKDAPIPECPIPGETWKEIKHDNTNSFLAFWNDPITKGFKYVFLSPSSSLKGQSDKNKYEKARNLKDHIESIRASYTKNFTAKEVSMRQIAVATFLIDKLALRAGNDKDDDEADTVGCCTLKVGNVECIPPNKLKFDFLGKDSIQYVNTVEVEPLVYKAIGQFRAGKSKSDHLFDEIDTSKLNSHLKELVPGLTAKVFRTYNASITLDVMLRQETRDGDDVNQKLVVYQKANKEVALICNHQRAVSKSHGAQIEKLAGKIQQLREGLKELKTNLERAKKGKNPDGKKKRDLTPEAWEKKIAQQMMKTKKMERDMKTKEDLKTVALGTSKINYMDPRITVAWCKRHEVPIEKIFNKSLLDKFSWAMDVEPHFTF